MEPARENLTRHDIFASNLILGESLFLSLHLPPGWELAPGVSRPEVVAAHERRNKRWVANGDAWYVVHDHERGWALELAIRIRTPIRSNGIPESAVSAGGHPASVNWKERRRGLPWRRHTVTFMTLAYGCPHTERRIELEFSGWCPYEGFREILSALEYVRCH